MALGDPGDKPHHIPGNPSPSMLGGDNRTDLGKNVIPGSPSNTPMPHNYGDKGDTPFCVPGSPSPDEVRSKFSGSS